MMRRLLACGVVLASVGMAAAEPAPAGSEALIGRRIDNFKLADFRGKEHSLADFANAKLVVVAFLGTECPLAKLYAPRLEELADAYADKGVAVIGIDSNRQDSITELAHYARTGGVEFPLLKDTGNAVADQFGATRTPEVFVLDSERAIRYVGRIDDQYGIGATSGYAKTEIRRRHLAAALDELLAGKSVSEPTSSVPGCLIGRTRVADEKSPVTYANQISRLLQKHCAECHRPGQIAPFSLGEYDEVAGWADMIEEVVREQRMPPWHADPKFGHFKNDRSLAPEEKELFFAWVKAGAPKGDPADLPPPAEFSTAWQIPNPDEIFAMSDEPYELPADGVLEYEYFEVDPGWTEDKWLQASECRIDNRAVVHHIFVFSVPPGVKIPNFKANREARMQAAREGRRLERPDDGFNPGTGGIELIAGAAPGTPPWQYGDGMATHLRAGTRLLFQMHYTPNGTKTKDLTSVAFVYAKPEEVKHDVRMSMAINPQFVIPAGADDYPVDAAYNFHKDSLVMTMAPHMHLRGKAFRYDLEYPDGTQETILNVPRYDFNWQVIYMLAQPKFVPAGTKMRCRALFDNSANNMANPDPTQPVRWGDQTWEEMMIGWFSMSDDIDPSQVDPSLSRTKRFLAEANKRPLKLNSLLKRAAGSALESQNAADSLLRHVSKVVPQVDRVCVAAVEGDQTRLLLVAQPAVLEAALGNKERALSASGSELARCAAERKLVVHENLAQVAGAADLALMAKAMGSSLHVPVTIAGKPAVVSFWSREKGAFPEAAVGFLRSVAELLGDGKTDVSRRD